MPFTPPAAEASVRQSTATEEDTHYAMSLDVAWRTLSAPPPFLKVISQQALICFMTKNIVINGNAL